MPRADHSVVVPVVVGGGVGGVVFVVVVASGLPKNGKCMGFFWDMSLFQPSRNAMKRQQKYMFF